MGPCAWLSCRCAKMLGVEGNVVVNEGGNSEVGVVVALLHAVLQRQLALGRLLESPGVQLHGWGGRSGQQCEPCHS